MRIVWASEPTDEIKALVEKRVEEVKWLLPPWLAKLNINIISAGDDDSKATLASMEVSYEYRFATLSLLGMWFGESEEEQRLTLIHEFLHASTSVITDYVTEMFDKLTPDAPVMNGMLHEELRMRLESATEDMTNLIYNKVYSF